MRFDQEGKGTFSVKKAHVGALFFLKLKEFVVHDTMKHVTSNAADDFWNRDSGRLVVLVRVRSTSITVFDGAGLHTVEPKQATLVPVSLVKKSKKRVYNSEEE